MNQSVIKFLLAILMFAFGVYSQSTTEYAIMSSQFYTETSDTETPEAVTDPPINSTLTPPQTPSETTTPTTHPTTSATQTTFTTDVSTTDTPQTLLCNEDFSYNFQYYISKWPAVRPATFSYAQCPTGYVGIATWFCQYDLNFDVNGPEITCTQLWIQDLYDNVIYANITSIEEVIKYIDLLDEGLDANDITYYVELDKIVEIVEKLLFYSNIFIDSNQYLNETEIIANKVIGIYSIVLSRSKPWMQTNQLYPSTPIPSTINPTTTTNNPTTNTPTINPTTTTNQPTAPNPSSTTSQATNTPIINPSTTPNPQTTIPIVTIYSNLLSISKSRIQANQFERSVISEKIVLQVQYASFLLGCQQNTTTTESITSNNIYVENFKLNETGYTLESSRTNSTIIIPANVHIALPNLPLFCPQRTAFAVIYERIDEYFNVNLSESETIASNIIGFSFTNDTKTYTLNNGLKAKIILEHRNRLNFGDKIRCAFWDFAATRWSSDGCERIANESNRDITTCECNHLTNFAAILDISGRETNGGLKSTFTTVCSSMSCMGLIMTIIMILLSKSNNRKKEKIAELRDTVTFNLCFCLIMVNLLVLFGMDQTNTKWLCQTLSALLLYSLLSAFCWMLFEGIIVYKMTVQVFPDYYRNIKLFNYVISYGTPILVLIIAITMFGLTNIYEDYGLFDVFFKDKSINYFCWISSPVNPYNIWIFAAPASLIMIGNFVILILSVKSVCVAMKPNYMLVIGYTSFTFFLGLTWLFFILYIEQFGQFFVYFSYFFIIINGLQGAFIHLFQTIHTARTVKYGMKESSDGANYES